jgi:hypothetical protein
LGFAVNVRTFSIRQSIGIFFQKQDFKAVDNLWLQEGWQFRAMSGEFWTTSFEQLTGNS